MKKNFKVFGLFIIVSLFGINLYGQSYDCKAENSQFRSDKNNWVVQDADKPFSSSDIAEFDGLFYYPVDCKFVFNGTLSLNEPMKIVNVETTDGGSVQLYDYGTVSYTVGEKKYDLAVYKNIDMPEFGNAKETIFIPIKDGTSGPALNTTFASGRYLIIQPPASGNKVILDFNKAINPFENYNSKYSALIVPSSNVILAPLTTGERKYEDR